MRHPILGSVLLATIELLASPVFAAHVTTSSVTGSQWSVDLATALADAKTSNRLVLVCFNMDGEQANERALAMYRSAEFAKATADVICVLCSSDEHDAEGVPCSRFKSCSCREHCDSEKQARRRFFGDLRDNIAPQHILLYPDGLVAWHAIYEVEPGALAKAIEGTQRLKGQPLAARLRSQQSFLADMGRRASKNVATAYMQVQARLVQTPPDRFLEALRSLSNDVAERILRDLPGYTSEQALPLLRAACNHPRKEFKQLAQTLLAEAEGAAARAAKAAPKPAAQEASAAVPAAPLTAPLKVLAPGDDLGRVYWTGDEVSLASCRDQVTVLWFFLPEAQDLARQVEAMNEFAAAQAGHGVRTLGLACTQRPSEALAKLAELGCRFPVGSYQATNAMKLFEVSRFPSWVVLDPETDVVYRSPQDGTSFEWNEGRDLAARMAVSPAYASRLAPPAPAGAKR